MLWGLPEGVEGTGWRGTKAKKIRRTGAVKSIKYNLKKIKKSQIKNNNFTPQRTRETAKNKAQRK